MQIHCYIYTLKSSTLHRSSGAAVGLRMRNRFASRESGFRARAMATSRVGKPVLVCKYVQFRLHLVDYSRFSRGRGDVLIYDA